MYRPSSVVIVSSRTLSAMTTAIASGSPRTVARYGVVLAMGLHYPTSCRPGAAAVRTAPRRSTGGTHGDHLDDATRAVDGVDDAKPPHPELPPFDTGVDRRTY